MISQEPRGSVLDTSTSQTEQKLVGIRGWLIFPAIGLAIAPVIGVIGQVATLASLERVLFTRYGAYLMICAVVDISLLIYLWAAAVRFFEKRHHAPQTLIQYMKIRLLASVGQLVLAIAVTGGGRELVLLSLLSGNNFIAQGIAAAIWIPYFKVSKRVKATFVN